jgi:hypothetical protein
MFARFFPALTRLSIQQMLTFALFVGILSAGFFLAFVSPLVFSPKAIGARQSLF